MRPACCGEVSPQGARRRAAAIASPRVDHWSASGCASALDESSHCCGVGCPRQGEFRGSLGGYGYSFGSGGGRDAEPATGREAT